MNLATASTFLPTFTLEPRVVDDAVERALARVAPVFPLDRFVAVNPFLGVTDQPLTAAAARLQRVTGAQLFMPRRYHREAYADGRLEERDIRAALASLVARGESVPPLGAVLHGLGAVADRTSPSAVTFACLLDDVLERPVSRAVTESISSFSASYFDEGQARWQMPERGPSAWRAWRAWAHADLSAGAMGLPDLRRFFRALPEDPKVAIRETVSALAIPVSALDAYLHRALGTIAGWASYARERGWRASLEGTRDETLLELLAIRIAWDRALFQSHEDEHLRGAWSVALRAMSALDLYTLDREQRIDFVLLEAMEAAFRRRTFPELAKVRSVTPARRPAVQSVFCIDVRSEVFRRALEAELPDGETLGFAGFFGVAMSYEPLGGAPRTEQYPVLLQAKHVLPEGGDASEAVRGARARDRNRRGILGTFKSAAVGGLAYVETLGPSSVLSLLKDAAGLPRSDASTASHGPPDLSQMTVGAKVATAESLLRGTSLHGRLARIVLLTAHGSTTENNPHAAGLRCGACGGQGGAPNARAAAAILNDRETRRGLTARGLTVPDDTHFVAGSHDTTTDEVTLFDLHRAPPSHHAELDALVSALARASKRSRRERAPSLGVPVEASETLPSRSRDWSEVRPEWGLAGNALFIAARRERTRDLDLRGRAFLHTYDHRLDPTRAVLELILTAPMVVASWINLQYYASTVDPHAFGAGNKTLHDVVGTLGVLEGNGGDLRTGLPLQSVHDGRRFVHEPIRLHVLIEAPEASIDAALAAHPRVRELVTNGWIHLFSLGEGRITRCSGGGWLPEGA